MVLRASMPSAPLVGLDGRREKSTRDREELKSQLMAWEKNFGVGTTGFPDFIEKWNRRKFFITGGALVAGVAAAGATAGLTPGVGILAAATGLYWAVGIKDLRQVKHAVRKNFPVLGRLRYIFEVMRPEVRQYFIESDSEGAPFSRLQRSVAYQRAKNMSDTLPFGTRRDVYAGGYEWVTHSLYPTHVPEENRRVEIGCTNPDTTQPYSASLLNVSAMSYGALSDNAILALNGGARMGDFYHNTGEGGVSRFHLRPGGDIVWNIGTGYFGCRNADGTFSPERFRETSSRPQIRMIELKLSQGAKPGHGGLLPAAKITPAIAEARGLPGPPYHDCHSPARHSAFCDARSMLEFIGRLRQLSGGKPVGFKMCFGRPEEFLDLCKAMLETGITPDFITIDGGEGGTGAAPHEFSNAVGMPLAEGLYITNNLLIGCGLRDRIKIIAAGKVVSGFSLIRMLALGADVTNAARSMMFALGCIQALKCNTNHCPTGITTQNPELMQGLDIDNKAMRVRNFQKKTVEAACDIFGACGIDHPSKFNRSMILRRISGTKVLTYEELYPYFRPGDLVNGRAPESLQGLFDANHDGYITLAEFRRTLTDLSPSQHHQDN